MELRGHSVRMDRQFAVRYSLKYYLLSIVVISLFIFKAFVLKKKIFVAKKCYEIGQTEHKFECNIK